MNGCLTTIPSATGENSYFAEGKNTDGPLGDVSVACLPPAPKENGIKMKKRIHADKNVFGFIKTPEKDPAKRYHLNFYMWIS